MYIKILFILCSDTEFETNIHVCTCTTHTNCKQMPNQTCTCIKSLQFLSVVLYLMTISMFDKVKFEMVYNEHVASSSLFSCLSLQ